MTVTTLHTYYILYFFKGIVNNVFTLITNLSCMALYAIIVFGKV